jgi:hypothetical protein
MKKMNMKKMLLTSGVLVLFGGVQIAQADINTYNITESFAEPDYTYDTVFQGTFTYNTATNTVSNLQGTLSEVMTGDGVNPSTETYITLSNQLVTQSVAGGSLVTAFKNTNTNTFATSYTSGGHTYTGDGWSATGGVAVNSKYYGYGQPGATYANSGENASATVYIPDNPLTTLTQAQVNQLAYADYTEGGQMGSVGMTGISPALYGKAGTMGGYPVSEVITQTSDIPSTPIPAAAWLLGSGLMGLVGLKRKSRS